MELAGTDKIMGHIQDGLAPGWAIADQQVPSTARTCCQPDLVLQKLNVLVYGLQITPTSRATHMARGKMTFERSKAEEKFTQTLKADKEFVSEKERVRKVNQEKIARLKALRLAKEASESA